MIKSGNSKDFGIAMKRRSFNIAMNTIICRLERRMKANPAYSRILQKR
jgi:hypothetical protein